MDLLRIYYYTGIPILTCNMLFYSIQALSTSITSSQNVVRFISEHKACDSTVFKNEIETLDLQNKLKVVESLIFDIIKRHCYSDVEISDIKQNISTPLVTCNTLEDTNGFEMVEFKNRFAVLERVAEPIRYSLLSTCETVVNINELMLKIREKIVTHNQSYLNKIVSLCLQTEINELKKNVKILDMRLELLLNLLKIYVPITIKG